MRTHNDLGAKIRKLHRDYKIALAMTLAGKSDAEIVAKLALPEVDEAKLKENMQRLLQHLRLDSFDDVALHGRPVRRALAQFAPEAAIAAEGTEGDA
jgi:hypothetical protein